MRPWLLNPPPSPPNNAWSTITLANPGNYRHVWYRSADNGYGNVSEVEFYDASGTKHTGTPYGTTPFWANSATFYNSSSAQHHL